MGWDLQVYTLTMDCGGVYEVYLDTGLRRYQWLLYTLFLDWGNVYLIQIISPV